MKIYVINLDRRPDRLAEMTQRLNALGLEFERVSAVDAKTARFMWQVSWWKSFVVHLMHRPLRGQIAAYLSHRKVWADIIDKNIPQALIFEDDAEVVDWDSAILDVSIAEFQLDLLRLERIEASTWNDFGFDGSRQLILGHEAVSEMTFGAASYLISNEGAKKCHGLGKFWFYIDEYDLWAKIVGLRTAALRPVMFKQSGSASDIQVQPESQNSALYRKFDQLFLRPFARALAKHARRMLIAYQSKS